MALNNIPNTRFGFYGKHNGKWLKFEPDDDFSRDIGATIQAHESFGPNSTTSTPPQLFQDLTPSTSFQPDDLINLTEDIFGKA